MIAMLKPYGVRRSKLSWPSNSKQRIARSYGDAHRSLIWRRIKRMRRRTLQYLSEAASVLLLRATENDESGCIGVSLLQSIRHPLLSQGRSIAARQYRRFITCSIGSVAMCIGHATTSLEFVTVDNSSFDDEALFHSAGIATVPSCRSMDRKMHSIIIIIDAERGVGRGV